MGYTTDFDGVFKLNKALDIKTYKQLEEIQEIRHEGKTAIPNVGIWCKWAPTEDGSGIEWNGNEKFYDYIEWLEYLIEAILAPKGYVLSGEVFWSGEDSKDHGILIVEDNVLTVKYGKIVYE